MKGVHAPNALSWLYPFSSLLHCTVFVSRAWWIGRMRCLLPGSYAGRATRHRAAHTPYGHNKDSTHNSTTRHRGFKSVTPSLTSTTSSDVSHQRLAETTMSAPR